MGGRGIYTTSGDASLVFRDGQLLRHQDGLTLVQYRSDARLAEVRPEEEAITA